MTFSARSLSRNEPGSIAVPLMGDELTMSPSRARKRSGDAEATATPRSGSETTALNGAGLPSANDAPSASIR